MKNAFVLLAVCAVLVIAIAVGIMNAGPARVRTAGSDPAPAVPSVGKIQVLNGCGIDGAANVIAEFLRSQDFDVKDIGNAPMSNYQSTLVASRTKDMNIARQVARSLHSDAVFLMRTGDTTYSVTVFVGSDYKERAR